MIIKVEKCKQCPFHDYERGHGSSFYICAHKERDSYDYIIRDLSTIPEWCPLKDESVEIELKDN